MKNLNENKGLNSLFAYAAAYEVLPNAVALIDQRGFFQYLNPAMRARLDFNEADLSRLLVCDPLETDDSRTVFMSIKDMFLALVPGVSQEAEAMFVHDKRVLLTGRVKLALIQQSSDNEPLISMSLLRVNSVEKTQSGISQKFVQTIIDSTSDAIFLAPISPEGVHGNFVEVNNEACHRLGYTREELFRVNARILNPSANFERVKNYGQMLMRERRAIFEAIHVAKDGTQIPVEVNASVIEVEGENYVLSVVKDLRHHKQLEKTETLFGRVMDHSWNEFYIINSETLELVLINQGGQNNLGLSSNEIVGKKFIDLVEDMSEESFRQLAADLFNGTQNQVIFELIMRRRNGTTYPAEVRLQISPSEVPPVFVANVQDISERKKIERRLTYLANYDPLTGLPNRSLFVDRMNVAMEAAKRTEALIAVMFLDLDGFKQINDSYGHEVGDKLIREVGKRLTRAVRKSDTVARLSGDEFTLLLNNIRHISGVDIVAEKILSSLCQPFVIEGKQLLTSPSIGITLYPFNDNDNSVEVLRQADTAMYYAKKAGKRTYKYYSVELSANETRRAKLESALLSALDRGEFEIYYQPKVRLDDHFIIGAEALLRWHNPQLGMVSPVEFIPLLESAGLMNKVGDWIIEQSCDQVAKWIRAGHEFRLSINVSARQFDGGKICDLVERVFIEQELPGENIELEITEGILISQTSGAEEILNRLKRTGVSISLDDFGTGYSSLGYLKQFPIDILKIDRSFIMDMNENQDSMVIVEAIIGLAKSLNLKVTAEGIEESWHVEFLKERGCDEGQGYLFGKPIPVSEFEQLLSRQKGNN